jgi:hypothetical protein
MQERETEFQVSDILERLFIHCSIKISTPEEDPAL